MKKNFISQDYNKWPDWLKDDWEGREGYVWFVELKETAQWIAEDFSLTIDPLKAKQFKNKMQAITFCIENAFGIEYTQTEHEFPK